MPKTIDISTAYPDFDGLINVRFVSENGSVEKIVENINIFDEQKDIYESLNEDEKTGSKFVIACRRFILVKYGVEVSVVAAKKYYDDLSKALEDAKSFFFHTPSSQDSTT